MAGKYAQQNLQERIAGLEEEENAQRRRKHTIQKRCNNYRNFFDSVEDLIFVLNPKGDIQQVNESVRIELGYAKNELIGSNILAVHPEERRPEAASLFHDAISGKARRCPIALLAQNGLHIPVETTVTRGTWNGKLAFFTVSRLVRSTGGTEDGFNTRNDDLIKTNQRLKYEIERRKRAEEASKLAQKRLVAAIETLDDGFVLYDNDDRLVLCNRKYMEIYKDSADLIVSGAKFEDLVRKSAERGQYVEAIGRVEEWVEERMKFHRSADQTIEQHLGDGRWVRVAEHKMEDGCTVGFRVDITDYKMAEQALRKAHHDLEDKVEARTAELKAINKALQHEIQTRKKVEVELKRRNEFLSALHEMSLGMFRRLDLNELLQAIVSRASGLTQIPDGFLYLVNQEAQVLEISATCGNYAKLTEYSIKPWEGLAGNVWQKGETMIVDDYQAWPDKNPAPKFGFIRAIVGLPLISGSGVEGVIGLSHSFAGKPIEPEIIPTLAQFAELAAIAIDNARLFGELESELEKRNKLENEQKEMAFRLHQAQKMESIGTLAGGIAHDFNNILTSVIGYTELALFDAPKGSALEENLQGILTAGNRAKDLVKQILSFARQSEENIEPLWIGAIAKEVLKFMRASIPATIEIKQRIESEALVMGNTAQIHQLLLNLCTNATHAMEESGGVLEVCLRNVTFDALREFRLGQLDPGDYIEVMVADTGTGIAPDIIDSIFDPYFTTKALGKGTGMGLSIVYGIVESYKGRITVDSKLGAGTVFTFYLPIAHTQSNRIEQPKEDLPVGGERILMIDDEAPIAEMSGRMLEYLGYDVTTRTNSVEALDLFRAQPDAFDLVITDMTMPTLTGDKLAMALMQIRPDLPVILCTGYSNAITKENASRIGIKALTYKPMSKTDLATIVRKVLDEVQQRKNR